MQTKYRYLKDGKVYGNDKPYIEPCYQTLTDPEGEEYLDEWNDSEIELACDKEQILKIRESIYFSNKEHQGLKFLAFIENTIDITSITTVKDECNKVCETECIQCDFLIKKVYFKEVESKQTCNDNAMADYITNYVNNLPDTWTTKFDMNLAMKNAMVEAVSYPEKYLNK